MRRRRNFVTAYANAVVESRSHRLYYRNNSDTSRKSVAVFLPHASSPAVCLQRSMEVAFTMLNPLQTSFKDELIHRVT